jgi:hypothetical protein
VLLVSYREKGCLQTPDTHTSCRLADWQIGRLADWQIGRLADWQIGSLTLSVRYIYYIIILIYRANVCP